jgi:hypothetical protein
MSEFWTWVELLPLSARIGESWWFPLLESIHVLTAMFVVGSVLFVDLRLLGLSASKSSAVRFTNEIIRWTLGSFVIAIVSGIGMFMPRAAWYVMNPAFQLKLLMLLLAAANMIAFHSVTSRTSSTRTTTTVTSSGARLAGGVSLLLWAGITLAGRWTGHLS